MNTDELIQDKNMQCIDKVTKFDINKCSNNQKKLQFENSNEIDALNLGHDLAWEKCILGVSGGSNSISLASIKSWILIFKAQQVFVSCPGLLE